MKFGCNISKDTWLAEEEKAKFPHFSKMQQCLQENSVFKYYYFVLGFPSLFHRECNFMNVLILGSDHIKLNSEPVVVDINH